jgi:GTPase SAR1 family protein
MIFICLFIHIDIFVFCFFLVGLLFIETSAKTGENVEEAFLKTARAIHDQIQQGLVDLSSKTSGVQHTPQANIALTAAPTAAKSEGGCC